MKIQNATIHVSLPFGGAADERARLFEGLQRFANLGESEEDFGKFARQWPRFAPVEFRKGERSDEPSGEPMGLTPEMHGIVLKYQGYLRRVWLSDPETDRRGLADLLLGLGMDLAKPYPQSSTRLEKSRWPSSLAKLIGDPATCDADQSAALPTDVAEPGPQSAMGVETAERQSLKQMIDSLTGHDSKQYAVYPKVVASWKLGEFNYSPLTDFQRAFYLLFREKWRARICAHCARYFIADKPPQRYCSTACHGKAKSKQALRWWRTKGDASRRERMRKNRKKKAHGVGK